MRWSGSLIKPLSPTANDASAPSPWPVYEMGVPLVDLTKSMALADELDDQAKGVSIATQQALPLPDLQNAPSK